jgi:tRNA dimethylallyltransferase
LDRNAIGRSSTDTIFVIIPVKSATSRHPPAPAPSLVVVVGGPTASGKSALALALAEERGATVINADSLQCYRDLRVLTARPDPAAEAKAPHRLYGVLDAAEPGSAGRWRASALTEIAASVAAGRLPIVVGGSGLYLRALTGGLAPIPEIPDRVRQQARALFQTEGAAAFRRRLARLDRAAAERLAPGDPQRLVRAYEVVRATGRPIGWWLAQPCGAPPYRFATILMMPPRAALYAACDARLEAMIESGGLDEAAALLRRRLDPGLPAMKAAGLPELFAHLTGAIGLGEAIAAAQRATRRYAKRQMTWFRHQFRPDLILGEQFSERSGSVLRRFIDETLLAGRAC